MAIEEIHESNTQFLGSWRLFARNTPKGEVVELPEVHIASANVAWQIMNAAFLPAPVETEDALERAAAASARFFTPRERGWTLVVCEDWLAPSLRAKAGALLARYGLKSALDTIGMVAESLVPPTQPLPALEVRQAVDTLGRYHIADINARSYEVPLEMALEALDVPAHFTGEARGYVGFLNGKGACSTVVTPVEGVAYISLVATQPEQRRQGCAEALIRHALAEAERAWGLRRTVLHATPAGYPVYLRMGYRHVTRFHLYMSV
jgi:ribosomal protein S18 acetylase RimI-like enzyme